VVGVALAVGDPVADVDAEVVGWAALACVVGSLEPAEGVEDAVVHPQVSSAPATAAAAYRLMART